MICGSCLVAGCRDEVEIAAGLDPRQANRVLVFLSGDVPSARSTKDRTAADAFSVFVARRDETWARALVERFDLLGTSGSLAAHFDEGALIPSAIADRARLMAGLGRNLGDSLELVDGVLRARVHVMLPGDDDLALTAHAGGTPTASVLLLCTAPLEPGPESQPIADHDVKRLVAGAVENLVPENIDVVYTYTETRLPESRTTAPVDESDLPSMPRRMMWVAFLSVVGVLSITVAVLSFRRRGPTV